MLIIAPLGVISVFLFDFKYFKILPRIGQISGHTISHAQCAYVPGSNSVVFLLSMIPCDVLRTPWNLLLQTRSVLPDGSGWDLAGWLLSMALLHGNIWLENIPLLHIDFWTQDLDIFLLTTETWCILCLWFVPSVRKATSGYTNNIMALCEMQILHLQPEFCFVSLKTARLISLTLRYHCWLSENLFYRRFHNLDNWPVSTQANSLVFVWFLIQVKWD